jgi:hypothetical protein
MTNEQLWKEFHNLSVPIGSRRRRIRFRRRCEEIVKTMAPFDANRCHTPPSVAQECGPRSTWCTQASIARHAAPPVSLELVAIDALETHLEVIEGPRDGSRSVNYLDRSHRAARNRIAAS